jgi:hypothetical protein
MREEKNPNTTAVHNSGDGVGLEGRHGECNQQVKDTLSANSGVFRV